MQSLGTCQLHADSGLAIDEFNYCEQGAAVDSVLVREHVDDLPGLSTGLSIDSLLETAERIAHRTLDVVKTLKGNRLRFVRTA